MARLIRATARRAFAPAILSALLPMAMAEGDHLAAEEPAPQPVSVGGQVKDRVTGEALEAARILLRPAEGVEAQTHTAVTGADGTFRIDGVEEGPFVLEIRHVGYGPVDHHLTVPGDEDIRLEVEMVPDPIELAPVVATAEPDIPPRMVGFYDRKGRGIGRHLSRDDIDDRNPFRVSDLFRTMRGVSVQPGPRGTGGRILMGRGCEPTVYIDGTRTTEGARFIDEYVSTADLEAVEVYSMSEAPGEFQHGSCGAVVLWTRPPGTDGDGSPWSWRRALVAASILGFIFLR